MCSKTALVTGANGFLGFPVLVSALKAGYRVRGTVRRSEAAQEVLKAKLIQPYRDQLEIVIVNDILEDGAFDEAATGMDYVLHIASPIPKPSEDYVKDFIDPAVQGTLGLLRSAAKSLSVKRIVITSSVVVLDFEKPGRISVQDLGPIPALDKLLNASAGYVASKRVAFLKTNQFFDENKPSFDIIHVLPSVILGRNELSTTRSDFASGTNRNVINVALGKDTPAPLVGATVFVNDCAEVHVQALDERVKGNQNFIASAGPVVWNDVNEIVKNGFGVKAMEHGLKLGGNLDTIPLDFDTAETYKEFRLEWVPFEQQVKSVVGHFLELE